MSELPLSPLPNTSMPARLERIAGGVDRFGALASFLCALHCALLPLALAVLPAIGLGILVSHTFERVFASAAIVLALVSLLAGYFAHRRYHALALLLPGIALLLFGISMSEHTGSFRHAAIVAAGGTLLALAHVVNLRLRRAHRTTCARPHPHDAAC